MAENFFFFLFLCLNEFMRLRKVLLGCCFHFHGICERRSSPLSVTVIFPMCSSSNLTYFMTPNLDPNEIFYNISESIKKRSSVEKKELVHC